MSRDDRTLQLLPLPGELARERASEEALADAPAPVQEWFDALGEDPDGDARLRDFLDELVPAPEGSGIDEDVDDEPSEAPPVIGAWLAATAHDPEQDARLAAFVETLVPERHGVGGRRLWTGVAAGLLAAAGLLLALQGSQAPSPTAASPLAPTAPATASAPMPAPASPVVDPVQPVRQPSSDLRPDQAVVADASASSPGSAGPVQQAGSLPRSPDPVPVTEPSLAAAPPPTSDRGSAAPHIPQQQDLAPAPIAPPLRTTGDLVATERPWRGDVVAGVDLRLEQGFGQLFGSQSAPQLNLAEGSTILVDIDRDSVDSDFETFTVHTLSATVTVLGTRYEVSTEHGRTTVSTRRGMVKVECADGRAVIVTAGQSTVCHPEPDERVLTHMDGLDRPPVDGHGRTLGMSEQYQHLLGLLDAADTRTYLATTEIMLSRAIADDGYRRALEAVRIDAMCRLGWEEPAQQAARTWLDTEPPVVLDGPSHVALMGCED